MTHPIYVCLEHKVTMHTCRNVGIHSRSKHNMDYIDAEERGIVVKIGDCNPQDTVYGRCPSPKDRPATDFELKEAERRAKRNAEVQ